MQTMSAASLEWYIVSTRPGGQDTALKKIVITGMATIHSVCAMAIYSATESFKDLRFTDNWGQ